MRVAFSSKRLEHGVQLARRTADDLQHVGGGGLLLQRFAQVFRALAQFPEQAGILDRNDGLSGEIAQQLDLLVGERPDLLSIDRDQTNEFGILEHRHDGLRPSTSDISEQDDGGVAVPDKPGLPEGLRYD